MKPLFTLGIFALCASSFSNANAQTYCEPTYDNECSGWTEYGPVSFEMGAFAHAPACDGGNYISENISAEAGDALTVEIWSSGWCSVGIAVDFNNDGDFEDAGETIYLPEYVSGNPTLYTGTVSIPATVADGSYRLRLWSRLGNAMGADDGVDPCGAYSYGRFADYTLTVGTPLPVVMEPLKVVLRDNVPTLTWSTTKEVNNRGFEIERSVDGKVFRFEHFISSLTPTGFSNDRLDYSYTHQTAAGTVYYRLKQVDIDGKYTYSNIASVTTVDESTFDVYPTSTSGLIHVKNVAYDAIIQVYNLEGKEVLKLPAAVINAIDLGMLPNGIYLIKHTSQESTSIKKITKH